MKKEINLIPSNENIHIIESFIEDICDYHNINDNYFANILMAVTEASKVVYRNESDRNIIITFERNINGLSFEISGELDWNELIINDNATMELDSDEGREIFMIWSMPDRVKISEDGKKILMTFSIENIDEGKENDRNKTMNYYFKEKKVITQKL